MAEGYQAAAEARQKDRAGIYTLSSCLFVDLQ